MQILGRALRQKPGEGKVARIIVPVFLAPGERPDAMMTSPAYRPLVEVLQGLRAHDESILQRLTAASAHASGTATEVVRLDPQPAGEREHRSQSPELGAPVDGHTEDADEQEQLGAAVEDEEAAPDAARVPLLRFSRPRDPAAPARFLRTRVLQPDSEVWLTGYEMLRRWVDERGDASVPADAVVTLEDGTEYHLGGWVQEQRTALAEGRLRPHRYDLLEELAMI